MTKLLQQNPINNTKYVFDELTQFFNSYDNKNYLSNELYEELNDSYVKLTSSYNNLYNEKFTDDFVIKLTKEDLKATKQKKSLL